MEYLKNVECTLSSGGGGGEDNEDAKTNKAEGGALCTNRKNGRSWNWW